MLPASIEISRGPGVPGKNRAPENSPPQLSLLFPSLPRQEPRSTSSCRSVVSFQISSLFSYPKPLSRSRSIPKRIFFQQQEVKGATRKNPDMPTSAELEKFSEFEDAELNKYILSTKEKRYKTALWELINRDYHKVATAASQKSKASVDASQDTRNSDKKKKKKRDRDENISDQGQALPYKAVEQDAKKKKVESTVANGPGEGIVEFTFNDDEEY